MGSCLGARVSPGADEERQVNRLLSAELEKEQKAAAKQTVILFLGTGEGGKSTFFKQLRIIHNADLTATEIASLRQQIRSMVIADTVTLVRGCLLPEMPAAIGCGLSFSTNLVDMLNGSTPTPDLVSHVIELAPVDEAILTPEAASLIDAIWGDPVVQKVWQNLPTCALPTTQ